MSSGWSRSCTAWATSGCGLCPNAYFNWQDAKNDNARKLAEKFIERFPDVAEQGRGRDWIYAGWLAELVGRLEQGDHLPYVVAEGLRIKPYSLSGLPICDYGGDHAVCMDFPLPPPGDLDDDPTEFTGQYAAPGLQAAVELASQPNYLGSPQVVSELVSRLLDVVINKRRGGASYQDQVNVIGEITNALTGDDSGYTRIPGWHTAEGLGQAIVRYFKMDPDYYSGETFPCLVYEGMHAVVLQIDKLLDGFQKDPKAEWSPHGLAQLNALHQFVVAGLLGTNVLINPEKTIVDFVWEPVTG